MGGSASTPKEDPATRALRKRQQEELIQLDDEQNTRIKRLMIASRGTRVYRGSAESRMLAGNSTASATSPTYGLVQSDARGYRRNFSADLQNKWLIRNAARTTP